MLCHQFTTKLDDILECFLCIDFRSVRIERFAFFWSSTSCLSTGPHRPPRLSISFTVQVLLLWCHSARTIVTVPWQPCNTDYICWQSGRRPLPSAIPPSSDHTFFVTLWFSLQEIVSKDEEKKNHMPWAADLCFLYLRVSQNTALYRNSEKRPQQPVQGLRALSPDCAQR